MAERRLFSKKITESDAFLDMPLSAQCLYFHLNMNADDDGFVANPKMIQRMIGASNDDAKLLISKNFLINFDNGIVVVKHWCIHNIIQKDRYKPTEYVEEKSQLYIKENKSYTLDATQGNKLIGNKMDTNCIQNVSKMETQVKLSKVKLSKDNIYKKECEEKSTQENYDFLKNIPTLEEIQSFITLKNFHFDAQRFKDYYDSINWMRGSSPIQNWQALCGTWEQKLIKEQIPKRDYDERTYSNEELQKIIIPIEEISEDMI